MTVERKAELRAWIISVFIHLIIVCILAGIGVFAMNKKDMAQDLAEVVWIENSGGGSSGSSGSSTISEAAVAAPSIETSVVIPEKEHKDKEKNTEVSPNPQSKAVSTNKAASANVAGAGNSSQGTGNGIGSGNGAGEGSGNGTGDGTGDGDGNGDGIGNGGGIGSSPSERAEAVCTHKATPKYPNRMKEQGIGGRVVLEIYVNPDDSIESVEVISSSGYGALDEAAINAAYRCRFAMNGLWGRYTLSYVFEVVDDDW